MAETLSQALSFALWELLLILASLALLQSIRVEGRQAPLPKPEIFAVFLSINILLASLPPVLLSFLKLNYTAAYWVTGILVLAGALLLRRFREAPLESRLDVQLLSGTGSGAWLLALSVGALIPGVFVGMKVPTDVDSYIYLDYLVEWMANRSTPYTFVGNYVPLWELCFLSEMVRGKGDLFFWALGLKPVILIGVVGYCLATLAGLPCRLAALSSVSLLSFWQFWAGASGVGSLKNDMLYNAGLLLVIYVLTKRSAGRAGPLDGYLFTAGTIFGAVKFSGPVFLAGALAFYAVLHWRDWWRKPGLTAEVKSRLRPVLAIGGAWFAFVGHYYWKNLLLYGNLFGTFQVKAMGIGLKGTRDYSQTSILSSIGDRRLWEIFLLPGGGLSPAGLWFPVVLAAGFLVGGGVLLEGLIRRFQGRSLAPERLLLAGLPLLGWFVYFASYFSGSAVPGDLLYVKYDLSTMRYATAALFTTEVLLMHLLLAGGVSEALLLAAGAVNFLTRLRLLSLRMWYPPKALLLIAGLCLTVAAVVWAVSRVRSDGRRLALACLLPLLAVALGGPFVVQKTVAVVPHYWQPVFHLVRDLPPSTVFLVTNTGPYRDWPHAFPGMGKRFQNQVRTGTESEASILIASGEWSPDYVVKFRDPNTPVSPELMNRFILRMKELGYEPRVMVDHALLLQRVRGIASAQPVAPSGGKAWYAEADPSNPAQPRIDSGAIVSRARACNQGEKVLQGQPLRLLECTTGGTVPAAPADGTSIWVGNVGPLNPAGIAQGLKYTFRQNAWTPDLASIPPLNPDFDFRLARASKSLGEWVVTNPGGGYEFEHRNEGGQAFLRVRSKGANSFVALVGRWPSTFTDGTPISVHVKLRCPKAEMCITDIFDFVGENKFERIFRPYNGSGDWQTLHLSRRVQFPSDQDYFDVTIADAKPGDYFDVSEFSLRRGLFPGP